MSRTVNKRSRTEYNQTVIGSDTESATATGQSTKSSRETRNLTSTETASGTTKERVNIGATIAFTIKLRNRTPLSSSNPAC